MKTVKKNNYIKILSVLIITLMIASGIGNITTDAANTESVDQVPSHINTGLENNATKDLNNITGEQIVIDGNSRASYELLKYGNQYDWKEAIWAPFGHGMRHQGGNGGHYIYYYFYLGQNVKQQIVDGSLQIGVEFCSWAFWPWVGGPDLWVYKYSTSEWIRIKQSMGNNDALQWGWYAPSTSANWISNAGSVYFCVFASDGDDVVVDDVGVRWQTQEYTVTFYTAPTSGCSIIFDGIVYHNGNSVSKSAGTYYVQGIPPSGYVFDHWTTTGGVSVANSHSASTTATVASPGGTLKANFSQIPNIIKFYVNPVSGGKITFYGMDYYNGGQCSIPDGTYSLVATASQGNVFGSWSITGSGNSIANLNSASTTATINNNGTITVNFPVTPTYPVTFYISPSGAGSITFAGVPVNNGQTIQKYAGTYTLVATPTSSYRFSSWSKTGGIVIANQGSASTQATVSSPGGTITANFDPIPHPPTAYIDSISPNPANQGQTVYFSGHGSDSDPGGYITGYQWRSSITGVLSAQASFSSNTLPSGTHIIYFKVKDNTDLWSSEVSQTLNIITQAIDLTVTSITIPEHPFNTRLVNIIGTVKNVGNIASPSFSCGLYVDGASTPLATTTVNGINPGASRDAQFSNIQLNPGNHTIKIWADYNNQVPEGNENNNVMERNRIWIKAFYVNVSLNWDASSSFINELHQAFRSASNYLYDYTDGYMCFDSVKIEENSTNWAIADIQIQQSYYVWPSANIGGIAQSNLHIYLGQKWYIREGGTDNIQINDWSSQNGFRTIMHEFGHYGLWLLDEYFDRNHNRFDNCTGGYHNGDDSGAWSVMYYQYTRTELCNPNNHNNQHGLPAQSCWTTLNNHYPFAPIPTQVNPGPNDNVGQYMEFTGLSPSPNPPWGDTQVNWVQYGPGFPQPNQQVSTSINVNDPNGIALVTLYYRVNSGGNISIPMQHTSGDNFSAVIPGQQSLSHVMFYFQIQDGLGNAFKYPVEEYFEYTVQASSNQPPNKPINPNPENGATHVGTNVTLSVLVTDPNGDNLIVYFYDASDNHLIEYMNATSGERAFVTWSGLQTDHEYRWYAIVNDSEYENQSDTWVFSTGTGINKPPNPPNLNENPSWWLPSIQYQLSVTTIDPEGDDLEYYVDWGDLTHTGWIGPYQSGETISINHTWNAESIFTVKAKARDIFGSESDWSDLFIINISEITTHRAFLGGFGTDKRIVGPFFYFRVEEFLMHGKLRPLQIEFLSTGREIVISQDYKLGAIIDLNPYMIIGFFDVYVIPESTHDTINRLITPIRTHHLQHPSVLKSDKIQNHMLEE